jgi:hypothetical protein
LAKVAVIFQKTMLCVGDREARADCQCGELMTILDGDWPMPV